MKKVINILSISVILITVLGVFFTACKKDDPVPTMVATSIELVSGGSQTAQVETELTNPVVVLVKDQEGKAFKGATVAFAVSEGAVSAATGTTDAEGKATVNWTVGTTVGAQTLAITAFKADGTTALTGSPISVTATASAEPLVATSMELVSGNSQTAQVETALANAIVVIVKDQNGDAFAGTNVSFTTNDGLVSNATVTTDANGNASVNWTIGATIGTQTLNASVTGITGSPIEYSATGVACMDYDGNIYDIVTIDTQTWMKENLKVTHFSNGDAIPNDPGNGNGVFTAAEWITLADDDAAKAYCYYGDLTNTLYGALYTYAAATNGDSDGTTQGVCPTGWHLPSNAEWNSLLNFLGSTAGGKMKETGTTYWDSPNTGATNTSGFTAYGAGGRSNSDVSSGGFFALRTGTYFWSSTQSVLEATKGNVVAIFNTGDNTSAATLNKSFGFSVRCVKD